MLHELRVENLLLLERAELHLGQGLNVLTGETGAGKTMLAQALDLLLGGRARSGIVRAGAREAYVEGVFAIPVALRAAVRERLPEESEELVLARRLWPDGRTRAYLGGRSATLAELRELGAELLHFYGQHEHRKLTLGSAQLDVVDEFCGPRHMALRARTKRAYDRVRELQRRTEELSGLAGARERELDLLSFEIDEIEAASPSESDEQELTAARDRLRHLDTLRAAAAGGAEAIAPESGMGVVELLAGPLHALESAARLDPALAELAERLGALRYEAEDIGGELRRYGLELEGAEGSAPMGIDEIEERLQLFARLKRKHGGAIDDVLAHAEACRARRAELEQAEVALEGAEGELEAARAELNRLAAALSERRRAAAPRLARAVRGRLAELAMPDAQFDVRLTPRGEGCGPRGAESVEFEIAVNPGVPAAPLREIASGGELSRVMLALLSVAHAPGGAQPGAADGEPAAPDGEPAAPDGDTAARDGALLVFDEVDAGIGGHTARAVGEHLRRLANGRQILCITHLPQIASLADRHFQIEKGSGGETATTTVSELEDDGVVLELVRMLGANEDDRAAVQHARELLRAA